MSSIACPHCGFAVAESPELAGQNVACPRCNGQFQMPLATKSGQSLMPARPTAAYPIPAAAPQAPQQPTVVYVQAGQTQEPISAGGWFTRVFAGAMGYFMASAVFSIALPLLGILLLCGGCILCGVFGNFVGDPDTLEVAKHEPKKIQSRPDAMEQPAIVEQTTNIPLDDAEPEPTTSFSDSQPPVDTFAPEPMSAPEPVPEPEPEEEKPMSRTWSSANGKFTIEATYRGIKRQVVTLEKADGTTIDVPLAQLSDEDKDWIANSKFRK